jgi:hypothetical protein
VFTVTTVLPLDLDWRSALAFEIELAEEVAAVFTLNGTLPRSEKSSFVFRAEYSHFASSLQRRVTVLVVPGTKHDMLFGGDTDLQMTITGERFADTLHRLMPAASEHKFIFAFECSTKN